MHRPKSRYQTALDDQVCRCELCPRHCLIKPDRTGFCGHWLNEAGTLVAALYGQVTAVALDPIEKKPLYHFHPGAGILSVGSNGCNLACRFCQNWHLSTSQADTKYMEPRQLADLAGKNGSIGLAFTYNEPSVWFEYILDTAALLKPKGLVTVLVTNGYLEAAPFDTLLPWVDAMNIDVKGDENFYQKLTGGHLAPVRRNVEAAFKAGVHVEVTNLLVTDANDGEKQIQKLVDWLAGVSPLIPLHLSRYFPNHLYQQPPTPLARLETAGVIARQKLKFVYLGNVHAGEWSETNCPHCNALLIRRQGYVILKNDLPPGGNCPACGRATGVIA